MQRSYAAYLGLFCALALAAALRWPELSDSLWLDELHTAWCASGSWADVAPRARIGNHSPLYFYLPRLAMTVGSASEITLRFPSFLAGLALVPLVGRLAWRWTSDAAAGWFAATLVAIDRHLIFYSQEARPYAWLQLLAWCHAAVVWKLKHQPTLRLRLAFVAGAVLMFHLHYTAALFCLGEAVFLLWVAAVGWRTAAPYRWRHLFTDWLIIALGWAPAISHLLMLAPNRQAWKSFVPRLSLSGAVPELNQIFHLNVYLLLPLAAVVGAALWHHYRTKLDWRKPDGTSVLLVTLLLLIPAGIAWIVTLTDQAPLFFRRYLTPSLLAPIATAALCMSSLPSSWLRGAIAALTIGLSVFTSGMVQQYSRDGRLFGARLQDWRGAVQFVNQYADPSLDVALVRGGYLEADKLRQRHTKLLEEYCLAPVNSLYRLQIQAISLPTTNASRLDAIQQEPLLRNRRIWFIFNGDVKSHQSFMANVEEHFRSQGAIASSDFVQTFGEVLVFRVVVNSER